MRHRLLTRLLLGAVALYAAVAHAQQIYRWTDADGRVHFGNQPPPGSKDLEAKDREKGEIEVECEAAIRADCQEWSKKWGKWQDSEAYRDCLERGAEKCARLQPIAKPTQGHERFVSTPALRFDPSLGDSLSCEMRCNSHCRGQLEIRADRVLKKGENYGNERYLMDVKPREAGSAYCAVTTPSEHVLLVLSVLRNGTATAVVEGQ